MVLKCYHPSDSSAANPVRSGRYCGDGRAQIKYPLASLVYWNTSPIMGAKAVWQVFERIGECRVVVFSEPT